MVNCMLYEFHPYFFLNGTTPLENTLAVSFFHSFYLFIYLFIYLFMAVLGLRFCARAFSSCGKQGPLFIAASRCGAQAPDAQAQ